LWAADVGDGYAGAVVLKGKVYLMDYDRDRKQDALRCLSAEDGAEIWRYAYPVSVKRNHGMSRTVPAVTEQFVVAMGPKCHVVCLDSATGSLRWGLDLVKQYGATVPPWYAGQCPLIDNGMIILAPGGTNALLIALRPDTGVALWQSPNPHAWKMTHSSIMPMEVDGERMYVYCANNGVVGVSAKDGTILWENTAWKISIATVPSPLVLPEGRVFLSGGYNAGSLMLQVNKEQGRWQVHTLFKLGPEVFGATQHTPIFFESHIYGVRPDGRFVCLDLDGKSVWTSPGSDQFGLGPFLVADGLIFAMNDAGLLRLIEATPQKYQSLSEAHVLKGRESWGPMALADGRLYARDLTRLVCLDVVGH
jgi:outer membrane protein assembly factor BamB